MPAWFIHPPANNPGVEVAGIGAPGIAQVHHQWSIVILALTLDEEAAEVGAHLCVYRSTLGRSARLRGLLSKAEEPS